LSKTKLLTELQNGTAERNCGDIGRCHLSRLAGSSKIKIRSSSRHEDRRALWRDELQILIFDDSAEQEE
jgi:hypothetical protein